MKILEAKQIISNLELSEGTLKLLRVLTEGDEERELGPMELRQLVALVEAEAESEMDEAAEIDNLVFKLKNILSGIDNAAEMYDKDLKSL
jgi:hypothetical protein